MLTQLIQRGLWKDLCNYETKITRVFKEKYNKINTYKDICNNLYITPNELDKFGVKTKKDGTRRSAFNVMSYENVSRETIISIWPELKDIPEDVYEEIEIESKYSGYLKRQLADIDVFKKDEKLKIREDINYEKIGGLSREMVQKLTKVKPMTIGEASRIPGVTPAAITAILGYVEKK